MFANISRRKVKIMNKPLAESSFLSRDYQENFFLHGEEGFSLKADTSSPGDSRLDNRKIFRKKYRVTNPSLIVLNDGELIPLPERGKLVVSKSGTVVHSQISGEYDRDRHENISSLSYIPSLKLRRINEPLFDLTSEGSALYSFWLLEASAKIKFLEWADGIDKENVSFLVNQVTPFVRDTLDIFGFSRSKVFSRNNSGCRFSSNKLITVANPRLDRYTPKWAIEYLRNHFLGQKAHSDWRGTKKKIYISRQRAASRRVVNYSQLEDFLLNQGFITIYPEELGLSETVEVIQGAEIVVSPHGAGLTNILFASSKAIVIELFGAHYTTQYRLLSRSLGQRYFAFDCTVPESNRSFDEFSLSDYTTGELNRMDMCVDMERFSRFYLENFY